MGTAVDQPRLEATRLGSYEILRKIARGGMAELFLARTRGPEGFEKLVVLKKILPNHAENPKFVRLFLDEAKLAATLDHPNIAHVYDMGTVDGNYFFTMEYVHGQDVRTTLRRTSRLGEKFPLEHAIQIGRNIAAALHYAHERRRPDGTLLDIVHRDVSPSNILISYDGAVKLVDFGVAKAATSTVKTRTGTLKGKISYMSPEQAKGAPIDRRSDIYSLGIVLWELVTTSRLYKTDNDLATIQMIINSKPQLPSQLRADCPAELERIVMKVLSVELAARYQTAEELQLDLEELARELKLKQSAVSLRAHMQVLFDAEIKAWLDAQASGVTLTEHVGGTTADMTTPVSESELEYLDEDEEEEPSTIEPPTSLQPTAGQLAATEVMPAQAEPIAPQPSVMVGRVDHTPYRVDLRPPTGPVRAPTPMPVAPPPPPLIAARANPTPFPVAPMEWRPSTGVPTPGEGLALHRRNRMAMGGAIAFATIVLVAVIVGGGDGSDEAASVVAPARVAEPPPQPAPAPEPAAKIDPPPPAAPEPPPAPPPPEEATPAPAPPPAAKPATKIPAKPAATHKPR